MTQDELAAKIDIGASHVSNLERRNKNLRLHTLDDIAKALRIPVHELLLSGPSPKYSDDPAVRRIKALVREATPRRRTAILKVVKTLAHTNKLLKGLERHRPGRARAAALTAAVRALPVGSPAHPPSL